MHPAYSVIFFTTASGAGYGLLALLGLGAALGVLPSRPLFGLVGLGLAVALISGGLLSSTVHLGRPERAWRALSQWRSSWLSREGVAAITTFLPAAVLAYGWILQGDLSGVFAVAGIACAVMAAITVFSTGMIYASLKTIDQWHLALVPAVYLLLALTTGALLLQALTVGAGGGPAGISPLAMASTLLAWGIKVAYWQRIDSLAPTSSMESATGLGAIGRVRLLEQPHTEANFLMREMGYRVARDHAAKLRRIATIGLFILPVGLSGLAAATGGAVALLASLAAVAAAGGGVLTERWLFFAEARHKSMLYYGHS